VDKKGIWCNSIRLHISEDFTSPLPGACHQLAKYFNLPVSPHFLNVQKKKTQRKQKKNIKTSTFFWFLSLFSIS